MVSFYVDDFLLASKSRKSVEWIKEKLNNEYNVKDLGEVKTIIGWQVTRDLEAKKLKIDKSAFIQDLVDEEGLSNGNSTNIPMKAGSFINMQEDDDYKEVDLKTYQQLGGKRMYLLCGTRPDIAFAVGQLSKRNLDPRIGHLKAAKQVVRYLKGTMHLGHKYGSILKTDSHIRAPEATPPYDLIGYADSNYTGDP